MVPTISFKQCTSSLLLSALLLTQVSAFASETINPTPSNQISNASPSEIKTVLKAIENALKALETVIKKEEPKITAPLSTSARIVTGAAIIFTLALLYQHYSANPKEVLEYPEDGNILEILTYYFKVLAGSREIPFHVDNISRIDDDNWKVNSSKKKPTGLPGYIYDNYKKVWLPTLGAVVAVAAGLKLMTSDLEGYAKIGDLPKELKDFADKLVKTVLS